MGWQCKLCASFNTDETSICEFSDAIVPFMASFHYEYMDSEHALIVWKTENALQIIAKYGGRSYSVTSW